MSRHRSILTLATAVVFVAGFPWTAEAHFLWLVVQPAPAPAGVHLYFSNAAEPDDPALLKRIRKPRILQVHKNGKTAPLKAALGKDSIVARLSARPESSQKAAAYVLKYRYGVISRGESTFLLNYYAKTFPASVSRKQWGNVQTAKVLPLDVVPAWTKGRLQLKVTWQGKPLPQAQVHLQGPGLEEPVTGATDKRGGFSIRLKKKGLYSIRVRYIEEKAGKLDGKRYDSIRHYSTLALRLPEKTE